MTKAGQVAVLILLAAVLLSSVPACQKKPPMMPGLQPLSVTTTAAEAGLTLFGTLHLGLRHLDATTRARYLHEVAGQSGDPFLPGSADQEEPFLVFLFTVDNQGDAPVLISPSFASLLGKKGKINTSPIDIRELSGLLAANPAFTPELSRRFHQATVNVNPGERHAKLLVFPAMARRVDMVDVVIPSVITGNLTADAHFPFSVTWEPSSGF